MGNIAVAGAICGFTAIVAAVGIERKCRREVWVKPWIIQRSIYSISGTYNKLFSDLLNSDQAAFSHFQLDVNSKHDMHAGLVRRDDITTCCHKLKNTKNTL